MPQTLLLVDDSLTIQRVIQLTFADDDIRVVAVGTVDQALAAMATTPPDIVLAAVGIPGQNGFDLARQLRRMPAIAHVPVLLLTGAFEPVDPEQARAVGANGVLVKPFEPAVVTARVRELLQGARERQPSGSPQPVPLKGSDAAGHRAADPPAPPPERVAHLDDYFAKLDAAISSRVADTLVRADGPADTAREATEDAPRDESGRDEALLSGAFSKLLAAEQRGAVSEAFDAWLPPVPATPVVLTPDTISDELVEAIVKRVLERLPDTVVRAAVSAIAAATAERVIREEIDRITNDIT